MDCCFTKSNLSSRRKWKTTTIEWESPWICGILPVLDRTLMSDLLTWSGATSEVQVLYFYGTGEAVGRARRVTTILTPTAFTVNNDCVRMACVPAGYSYVLIHLTLSRLADSYMTCLSSNSFSCWCAECNSRSWEVFQTKKHGILKLLQKPRAWLRFVFVTCILFAFISFSGLFINRTVAPARVAIAVIPVLIMLNLEHLSCRRAEQTGWFWSSALVFWIADLRAGSSLR